MYPDPMLLLRAVDQTGKDHPDAALPPVAEGLAPGGIVFQLWSEGRGVIAEHHVPPQTGDEALIALSSAVRDLGQGKVLEVRAYDGDDGSFIWKRWASLA